MTTLRANLPTHPATDHPAAAVGPDRQAPAASAAGFPAGRPVQLALLPWAGDPLPADPGEPLPYWRCERCGLTGAQGIGNTTLDEVEYLAEAHDRAWHGGEPTAVVVDPGAEARGAA